MWQNAAVNGTFEKITPLMNDQPMGVLSVSVCNEKEEWRYFIAVASTADIDDSLEEYVVPACTWAIFKATPHKGLKPVFVRYCLKGNLAFHKGGSICGRKAGLAQFCPFGKNRGLHQVHADQEPGRGAGRLFHGGIRCRSKPRGSLSGNR